MKRLPVCIVSVLVPLAVFSQQSGRTVYIDNSCFVTFCEMPDDFISTQEEDNWCWAACVQMMLRFNNEWLEQSEIVELVYGRPYDWTASGNAIAEAFDGWDYCQAKSFRQKSTRTLIDELNAHGPVMVGTGEHANLLTHIYYTRDLSPFKAILINPKTGREEVRNWSDFFPAVNTIVSIWR